jgi:hypothetical protein
MAADENLPADLLNVLLQGIRMQGMVATRALDIARYEGLDKDARVTSDGSEFHNRLQEYAMFKLAFYECSKCQLPYYGGLKECRAENPEEEKKLDEIKDEPQVLICGQCLSYSNSAAKTHCEKHGPDFIIYKCYYCCKQAIYICAGPRRYCEPCHTPTAKIKACEGFEKCEFKGFHPPNG